MMRSHSMRTKTVTRKLYNYWIMLRLPWIKLVSYGFVTIVMILSFRTDRSEQTVQTQEQSDHLDSLHYGRAT